MQHTCLNAYHTYTHTYMCNIHTYIHTYIHTCIRTYIQTYIHVHTYIHVQHTYTHTYIHTHIHTYMCTNMLKYITHDIYIYIYIYIQIHIHHRIHTTQPNVCQFSLMSSHLSPPASSPFVFSLRRLPSVVKPWVAERHLNHIQLPRRAGALSQIDIHKNISKNTKRQANDWKQGLGVTQNLDYLSSYLADLGGQP